MQQNSLVGSIVPTSKPPNRIEVQLLLGQLCLNKKQFTQAFNLFAVAAQSGQPQALNMLGRAYEQAWGVPRSIPQAIKYFEAAAEQNDGWAYFNLGDLYLSGDGVPQNTHRAFFYYVQAANLGVNKALNMLGTLCEKGIGEAPPDQTKALLYFQAGANVGDCWAAFNLGRLALEAEDYSTAVHWFDQSIPYGFPDYWIFLKNYLHKSSLPFSKLILQKIEIALQSTHSV